MFGALKYPRNRAWYHNHRVVYREQLALLLDRLTTLAREEVKDKAWNFVKSKLPVELCDMIMTECLAAEDLLEDGQEDGFKW
jgi:hypothetical protein